MANYNSGHARKNSDTRNLVILITSLVLLVALVITFVILQNKFWKKADKTISDSTYSAYVLSDYGKLLDQEKKDGGTYLIYVCTTDTSTTDNNLTIVLKYLDAQIEDSSLVTLYLLDYSKFDSTSDETETANAQKVEAELGFSVNVGYLIYVDDNEIVNKSTQVKTEAKVVQSTLKAMLNKKAWE